MARYFAVMKDERPAKFLISSRIAAEFVEQDSTDFLWQQHSKLINEHEV